MNWLIIVIGAFFALLVVWLILGSAHEFKPQPGNKAGRERRSLAPDDLIPLSYDDKLKNDRGALVTHERVKLAFDKGDLVGAVNVCRTLRESHPSAVNELNVAKLDLDMSDRYSMSPNLHKRWQNDATIALERADYLINGDQENRYPSELRARSQNLRNRLTNY